MSEKTKKFKVLSTTPLVKDAVVDLHDLQISASNDQGIITMVDMEAVEQEETNASYEIKPGIWRITPKAGLTPLELSDETYFETDTYRTLTKKFTNFRNKLETVFGKYGLMKKRAYLLGSDPGCHAKGQGILMYDGSIKKVEDIVVGDLLMGPNSKPREVLRLIRGRDKMVRIIPRKGDPFVVNWNHVQPFVSSHYDEYFFSPIKQMLCDDFCHGDSKLYRSEAINFTPNANKLPMPPYVLGLWLGDGTVSKPQLTTMDPEIAKAWSEYGRTLGCKITVRTKPGGLAKTYDIAKVEGRSNPLITILESFGYNRRHLTKKYIKEVIDESDFEKFSIYSNIRMELFMCTYEFFISFEEKELNIKPLLREYKLKRILK